MRRAILIAAAIGATLAYLTRARPPRLVHPGQQAQADMWREIDHILTRPVVWDDNGYN